MRAWVRLLLEVGFYGSLLILAVSPFVIWERATTTVIFYYVGAFAHLGVIVVVRRKVSQFYRATLTPVPDPGAVVDLNPEEDLRVRPLLEPLAQKLGVSLNRICLHEDLDDAGDTPRMIEARSLVHIILPLGFFALMDARPDMAQAMLAHELGHAAQRDTGSWIYATAYSEFVFRWLMPLWLAELALTLLWGVVAPETIVQQIQTGSTVEVSGSDVVQRPTYETRRSRIPSSTDYARSVAVPLLLAGSFLLIRRGRRLSEEMADLAACIAGTVEGLKAALANTEGAVSTKLAFCFRGPRRAGFAAIHPSVDFRLRRIEEYDKLDIGAVEADDVTSLVKAESRGGRYAKQGLGMVAVSVLVAAWGLAVGVDYASGHGVATAEGMLWSAGFLYLLGMLRVLHGLVNPRPMSRRRVGCLLLVIGTIMASLFAFVAGPLGSIVNYQNWMFISLAISGVLALLCGWIGIVWLLIAWLGRESS